MPGQGITRRHLGAVLLVGLLGVWQQWQAAPRSFPFGRFLQGTATLKDLVHNLPRVVPEGSELYVLARRPLAFYLLMQGRYPFRLLSGVGDVNVGIPDGGWAVVDGAVLHPELRQRLERMQAEATYREWLDPVTLLDVSPNSAFFDRERGPLPIWILSRRPGDPPLSVIGAPPPVTESF